MKVFSILMVFSFFVISCCDAQSNLLGNTQDSLRFDDTKIPFGYIKTVNKKIDKYNHRISHKTEKTLKRLSRWENRIHKLLLKADPATAQKLFGTGQMTFAEALKQYRLGRSIADGYIAKYDSYRDKLETQVRYFEEKRDELSHLSDSIRTKERSNIATLEKNIGESEFLTAFIRKRKNQLINEAVKHLGKNRYFKKMNQEAYYYVTSLRNYKEIFSDPKKIEEAVLKTLSGLPEFQQFAQKNTRLSGLFAMPVSFPSAQTISTMQVVNGLASRASLQQYLQTNSPVLNTSGLQQLMTVKVPDMSAVMNRLDVKSKSGDMGNVHFPGFKPSAQKSKTFFQRLEYGVDMQFGKSVNYLPATTNLAVKIGYKVDDKRSFGVGINYILGMGEGWNKIKFSNEGLGLRSYLKWNIFRGISLQGGAEWNYMLQFHKIEALKDHSAWKKSALIGMSKSFAAGKKVKGDFQVLFDFLYNYQLPVTQPFIFRYGYNF